MPRLESIFLLSEICLNVIESPKALMEIKNWKSIGQSYYRDSLWHLVSLDSNRSTAQIAAFKFGKNVILRLFLSNKGDRQRRKTKSGCFLTRQSGSFYILCCKIATEAITRVSFPPFDLLIKKLIALNQFHKIARKLQIRLTRS